VHDGERYGAMHQLSDAALAGELKRCAAESPFGFKPWFQREGESIRKRQWGTKMFNNRDKSTLYD
jgi:phage-related tail fiber protein